MKFIDRFLQKWRINKAISHIPNQSRVLDIGCFDALLFEKLGDKLTQGVGIDPLIKNIQTEKYELINGFFPSALTSSQSFNAITMLAVLEHIPQDEIMRFSKACFDFLLPGGRLIITVPDSKVDYILTFLRFVKLIDGMSLEEHYGFDIKQTPIIFTNAGFTLLIHSSFQLGLNNLFVFQKP